MNRPALLISKTIGLGALVVASFLVAGDRVGIGKTFETRIVDCPDCFTGKTVSLKLSRSTSLLVDKAPDEMGFMEGKFEAFSFRSHIIVFGPTRKADRFVAFDSERENSKKVDIVYLEMLKDLESGRFVLLEDSGQRSIAPHAIWLVDVSGKELRAEKLFDLFDPRVGGVADPLKNLDLEGDDGVGNVAWSPKMNGVLFEVIKGGESFLHFAGFIKNGVKRAHVKCKVPDGALSREMRWLDENTLEVDEDGGRKSHIRFPN